MAHLTTTLTGTDPVTRKTRSVAVTWAPQSLRGIDAGMDNVGRTQSLWATTDDPPCSLVLDPGYAHVEPDVRRAAGDVVEVFEAVEVDSVSEVREGCFFVDWDAPASGQEQWTVKEVAEFLGVKSGTVTSYLARGQMPEPDGRVGRTPWWAPSTILLWRGPQQ